MQFYNNICLHIYNNNSLYNSMINVHNIFSIIVINIYYILYTSNYLFSNVSMIVHKYVILIYYIIILNMIIY